MEAIAPRKAAGGSTPECTVRDVGARDAGELPRLVAADAVPYRPGVRAEDLDAALELSGPAPADCIVQRSVVAVLDDRVVGTGSWLDQRKADERFLLWLHGREMPDVTEA
jgi:hypothetical protein